MWGELVLARGISSYLYPRALPASEIMWSNPEDRGNNNANLKRFDDWACILYNGGIGVGAFNIGSPCFGYRNDVMEGEE